MPSKRIKMTLSLSKVIDDHITRLSDEDDESKPEVIRKALALYVHVKRETSEGKTLQILDESDNVKEIVFQ